MLCACHFNTENEARPVTSEETTDALIDTPMDLPVGIISEMEEKKDEENLKKALDSALQLSAGYFTLPFFDSDTFELKFNETVITTHFKIGDFFSNGRKYLMIYRSMYFEYKFVDVFEVLKDTLCLRIQSPGVNYFIRDSIADVNGDGLKDYLVHWYPTSGCCLREIYNVYLGQADSFSQEFEFCNPTFSPTEKLVRGVGYGHPGDCELYKYKWNGFALDTVEFIFPDFSTSSKKYYICNSMKDLFDTTRSEILESIPNDYSKIFGINWFKGES